MSVSVTFQWLKGADTSLGLPEPATAQAAGLDLRANLPQPARASGVLLTPSARVLVPLGLAMALPDGVEAQFRPRSGLALRHGLTLLNSPGTIDADYRGPLGVIVINHGHTAFRIRHGMRIAQMVIAPVTRPILRVVPSLDNTSRGSGGFGSTGLA